MLNYSLVKSETGESIVFYGDGQARHVQSSHSNFNNLRDYLLNGGDDIEEAILLADVIKSLKINLQKLSPRVSFNGEDILFDGDVVENKLTRHILSMLEAGDKNYGGYVQFLENLAGNPSKKSRRHLFAFLDKHDLLITEDGHFVGYKSVQNTEDNLSVTAGREPVTVTIDGETEEYTGNIPNPVGAVVEIPRSLVDEDRSVSCSVGLHVANHNYATEFFGGGNRKLLTVKVNPRDVVSVPNDHGDAKIRTCRYIVLEVNEGKVKYEGTSYYESKHAASDEDAVARCEECLTELDATEGNFCDDCRCHCGCMG